MEKNTKEDLNMRILHLILEIILIIRNMDKENQKTLKMGSFMMDSGFVYKFKV